MILISLVKDHTDIKRVVKVIDSEAHMSGNKKEKNLRKEIGIYVRHV